ncbi:MAG: helix-turn-helix transcriptional regulator [Coleofasciculus sp. D1-CHI-01]|jgi:DNA-binding XRE family transcriptional regulator|uniref:Helix-turn-helix domain protein n=1 Tax=Coleofasciculus chthonoplastes PCC 7420 TaxID=118168 RepID=B4VHZ6_9CYAN|nr:helix-turn-helix transcriptional regulator [Coleofasciculus chthonoplastes]EDX78550.1 Helix-turn-helix domain protein [Coleofasciculus chthonoplastes PCC 7420]
MTEKQEVEQESPLKSRRDQLGLTQRDVAVAVNVSVQTVSNWETGRYREAKLTLPQVKALCRVLQWTIDDLPDDLAPPRSQSADNV